MFKYVDGILNEIKDILDITTREKLRTITNLQDKFS